jgi:hypothetical protein
VAVALPTVSPSLVVAVLLGLPSLVVAVLLLGLPLVVALAPPCPALVAAPCWLLPPHAAPVTNDAQPIAAKMRPLTCVK